MLRNYGFKIYQVSFQGLFLGYVGLSNYTPIILHFRSEMKINMLLILGTSQCYLLFPVEAKNVHIYVYIHICMCAEYICIFSKYIYVRVYIYIRAYIYIYIQQDFLLVNLE